MKKLTVSVGISAYNEEKNILNVISTILSQKEKSIKIKEIIIASDGSTDKTVKIVKSLNNKKIHLIASKNRMGKPKRLMQIFKKFNAEIIVIIDADMILSNNNTLENLLRKFMTHKNTMVTFGNTYPLKAHTFIESAINNYIYARDSIRNMYSFGKTAYCAHAFIAYKKDFAKKLQYPKQLLNEDAYAYFSCETYGYKKYFVGNAIAIYRSPATIKDYFSQSIRHLSGGIQLYDFFGEKMVKKGFTMPKKALLYIMMYQLLHNPVGYVLLKTLNIYCKYKSGHTISFDPKWKTIETSKLALI